MLDEQRPVSAGEYRTTLIREAFKWDARPEDTEHPRRSLYYSYQKALDEAECIIFEEGGGLDTWV